jgi:hypothetical protein
MHHAHIEDRRSRRFAVGLAWAAAALLPIAAVAAPPYSGTAFIAPALITGDDPTAFATLTDHGTGMRQVYDRRIDAYVTMEVFLYEAAFSDGHVIEFQVNPEFGDVDASREPAVYYAPVFGRLPNVLRKHLAYVWIHQGDEPFGGTSFDGVHPSVLIHTGSLAQSYIAQGVLEEILLHEATHAVLDADVKDAPGWLSAQSEDAQFISTYARDNPTSEDVAESFLTYLAACCGRERVSAGLVETVTATIPARLRHFDSLYLDVRPLRDPEVIFRDAFDR